METNKRFQTNKTILIILVSLLSTLSVLGLTQIFHPIRAHAATIDVASGTDSVAEDSNCRLSEAIENINDQAVTNADCIAGDGIDDTIILPAGTITLSTDLPDINQPLSIEGQGIEDSIIDSDGTNGGFTFNNLGVSSISGSVDGLSLINPGDNSKYAIYASGYSISITNMEVYSENPSYVSSQIIYINGGGFSSASVNISDIYVHDLVTTSAIIGVAAKSGETLNDIVIKNNTFSDVEMSQGFAIGLTTFNDGGDVEGYIDNNTFQNIDFSVNGALIAATPNSFSGDGRVNAVVRNNTIKYTIQPSATFAMISPVGIAGAGYTSDSSIEAQNNIFTANTTGDKVALVCNEFAYGGDGTEITSITSLGGNITDDNTCSSYFTDSTDMNNVSNIASTLGNLGDYGGSVPTIPILSDSPAIDAGVVIAGLITDARGITRPKCVTYDSGSYEYDGTCPVISDLQTLSYIEPVKGKLVTLSLPTTVTNASVSAIDPTTIPSDGTLNYPAGLTTFQFDTTQGNTETITLYYDLPGEPSDFQARKYNTTDKTFTDIYDASITRTTYQGNSVLALSYDITDGGILDQDNEANGTIVDPVGLATTEGLADTGIDTSYVALMAVGSLIAVGLVGLKQKLIKITAKK
ncbi:hypothetical protein KC946_02625 [Candidatus Saccharibacteria bacterium]|nr:hypothetical protein [Candidatus Saccharibacteria bacterium]